MGGGASIASQISFSGMVDGGYWIDAKVMVHGRLVYRRLKHRKPIEISDDDDDEVVEVSSGEGWEGSEREGLSSLSVAFDHAGMLFMSFAVYIKNPCMYVLAPPLAH